MNNKTKIGFWICISLVWGFLIYGTINSDQNKISSEKIFIKEVNTLKKKNNENYKVCKIINGRAYTDFVEHVAVLKTELY